MCGNFLITADGEVLSMKLFREWRLARIMHGAEIADQWYPMFITRPSDRLPVVKPASGNPLELEFTLMEWGLKSRDWNDPKKIKIHVNARGESIHRLPSFREPFRKRRCLVLADGFFEPDKETRQPWLIRFRDRRLFAIAAVFSPAFHHEETGRDYSEAFTLVTTQPNGLIGTTVRHDRMPVLFSDPRDMQAWIDPKAGPEELRTLFRSHSDLELEAHEVSRGIYKMGSHDPAVLKPLDAGEHGPLQTSLL